MATISYVINAINNASRTFNDVADSAAKMDLAMDAAMRTADKLNTTLDTVNAAADAASAGLERLAKNSYQAAAAQTAAAAAATDLTARLNDVTASAVTSGAATNVFAGRWGFLLGLLRAPVPLFGGIFNIAAWHLAIDVVAEFAAVLIPATVAVAAFGAVAGPVFVDMYNQLVNVHSVVTATGREIYPFSSALTQLQNAVKPQAYKLFGDALVVASDKMGELKQLTIGTGSVLDQLGLRISAASTSGGLDAFMRNAVQDVQGLTTAFGNLFGAIGNLLHTMPGYANILLGIAVTLSHAFETLTGTRAVQDVANWGLALHGAFIYVGLAATGAMFALRGILTVVGNLAEKAALTTAGSDALAGLSARLLGVGAAAAESAAFLSGPWGAALLVAGAAVGYLIYRVSTAQDTVQKFIGAISGSALKASGTTAFGALNKEIDAIDSRLGPNTGQYGAIGFATREYGAAGIGGGGGLVAGVADYNRLIAQRAQAQQQLGVFNSRMGQLADHYHSATVAQNAFIESGVTVGQFVSKNANQWAQDQIAIQGVIDAYRALGQQGGELGNDVIVMGRLNGVTAEQVKAITALNQAYDSFTSSVTGSQSAFDTYGQGIGTLDAKQVAATLHLGQFNDAIKLGAKAIDGLSQGSLALNQAFTAQVTNTAQLFDAWRTAGLGGNTLAAGIKAAIQPLLPLARDSGEATAQLAALAAQAGYQGPPLYKNLVAWLGHTSDALMVVKKTSDQATIQSALLTTALQGQGAFIANQLVGDLNQAYLKYYGVYNAVTAYGNAVAQFGVKSDQARNARLLLIDDLVKAGHAANDSTGQIAAMISKILKIPLKRALQLVVQAEGSWKVTQVGGFNTGLPFGTVGGSAKKTAAGWYVTGGTPGVDSVPIMAMPGEVVVPTHMVNAGAVDHLKGQIPGMAAGGVVGSYASSSPSGLGTWTQNQYAATETAVSQSTAAATTAALKIATTVAQAFFGGGPGGGNAAVNAGLAKSLVPQWARDPYWSAWNYVAMRESGWDRFALNRSSGAYGIPQALPPTKMPFAAQAGGGSNAAAQILWMRDYMTGAYGGPLGAAAHEKAFNWYGSGGMISEPVIGMGLNSGQGYGFGEGGREIVTPVGGVQSARTPDTPLADRLDDILDALYQLVDATQAAPAQTAAGIAKSATAGNRSAGYRMMYSAKG